MWTESKTQRGLNHRRLGLLMSLLVPLSVASLSSVGHAQNMPEGTRLKDIRSPFLIGANIDEVYSKDSPQATAIATREYNSGQALWFAGYGGWPAQGQYNFINLNKGINWLKNNGKSPSVHMLVGQDKFMPEWLVGTPENPSPNYTPEQMDGWLKDMIDNVMISNDNKNKVDVWNVANEIMDDNGNYRNMKLNGIGWEEDQSGLPDSEKINARHPKFIGKAFRYARAHSSRILELRDYNIEIPFIPNWDKKHLALYQLVKHMINSGHPIDAVAIQGHYNVDPSSSTDNRLRDVIRKYKNLGVSVNIPELDFSNNKGWEDPSTFKPWDNTRAELQRANYYNIARQAIEGGVSRLETWGIRDNADVNWLVNEHPLMFDEHYNPKPAYYGVQSAMQEASKGFFIKARGSAGGERIELRVNDVPVASWVLSRDWAGYYYKGYSGTNNVKVAFTNDATVNGQDLNVQVEYLSFNGNVTLAQGRPNTGTSDGIGEWMWWNGAIDFGSIGSTPATPDVTYSFSDIPESYISPVDGAHGGINFGSGMWGAGNYYGFNQQCGFFRNNVSSRSFTLPSGKWLKNIKLSTEKSGTTWKIEDTSGNQNNKPVSGQFSSAYTPIAISTGWTQPSPTVKITFGAKWDSGIDDIVYGS